LVLKQSEEGSRLRRAVVVLKLESYLCVSLIILKEGGCGLCGLPNRYLVLNYSKKVKVIRHDDDDDDDDE